MSTEEREPMAPVEPVNVKYEFRGKIKRFIYEHRPFLMMKAKILEMEPEFHGYLVYIDDEGDRVAIECQADYKIALQIYKNSNASCFKLYCVETPKPEKSPPPYKSVVNVTHQYVYCDNCSESETEPIHGIRYKCAVCPDFDLCEECEKQGIHAEHAMIRYVDPQTPRFFGNFDAHIPTANPPGYSCPFRNAMTPGADRKDYRKEQKDRRREARQARREERHARRRERHGYQQEDVEKLIAERAAQVRSNVRTGVEYLKEVGSQLQQALMNFGIDCDVDVEHRGQRIPLNQYTQQMTPHNPDPQAQEPEPMQEGKLAPKPEMESTPLQRPSSIPIRHPVPADIYQSLMQQVSTPSEVLERAASAMLQKKPEEGETEAERDLREYGERVAKQAADRLNEAINSQQQVHEAAHRAAMQAATGAFKELNVSGALQTESEAPKKKFIVYSDSSDEEEEDEKTVHDIVDVSSAPTPNPTPTATQTNTPPSEMEQGRVEGDWFVMDNGSQPQSEPQEPQAQPEAHEGFTVFDMVAQVPSAPSTESSVVEITACTAGIPMHVPGRNSIRTPGPHDPNFGFIHPRHEIQQTAEMLVEMGYDNCNGWLTRLSEENDGDINRVIEAAHRDPLHNQRVQRLL